MDERKRELTKELATNKEMHEDLQKVFRSLSGVSDDKEIEKKIKEKLPHKEKQYTDKIFELVKMTRSETQKLYR